MNHIYRTGLVSILLVYAASTAAAQVPTPLHAYELNNSLTDTFGGPDLTNNGATLGATGLTFAPNQGPSLSSWLGGSATSGNYSIEMYFSITDVTGYRKLIDFQNKASDVGLYNLGTTLDFFPVTAGPGGAIPSNTMTHLVFTRDGGGNQVVGYINGATTLGLSFADGSNLAVFSAANNIINFLQDDGVQGTEASAGFLDFVRIYDHAVTAQDAANLFGQIAVPEPATFIAIGAGLFGTAIVITRRSRRKRRARTAAKKAMVA